MLVKWHGNRYDYTKVLYVAAISKVIIICSKHGEFEQTPANDCFGRGCRECGGNKPLTFDSFTERANKIYNGRYDYSRVKFKNVESKVEILCPVHGPFFQDRARIRIVNIWRFVVGRDAAKRETEILNQFARHRYYGPDVLVGAGNT